MCEGRHSKLLVHEALRGRHTFKLSRCFTAALLLLYCCFTAALLLLYWHTFELHLQGSAIGARPLLVYGALSSRLREYAALRARRTFELRLQGSAIGARPLELIVRVDAYAPSRRLLRTSAYVSIRQHTSAELIVRVDAYAPSRRLLRTSATVSIRQHTSAYVS